MENPDLPTTATGGCLCGAVRFRVAGPLRAILICHCTMCRRAGTHVGAFTACERADLRIADETALRWYRSSPIARRGFCGNCGSALFWEPAQATRISISAGSLDSPTGLAIERHMFVAEKGDYYEIADDLPRDA